MGTVIVPDFGRVFIRVDGLDPVDIGPQGRLIGAHPDDPHPADPHQGDPQQGDRWSVPATTYTTGRETRELARIPTVLGDLEDPLNNLAEAGKAEIRVRRPVPVQ
jgi:hypothetical protein